LRRIGPHLEACCEALTCRGLLRSCATVPVWIRPRKKSRNGAYSPHDAAASALLCD
jgi:hypothetical protein